MRAGNQVGTPAAGILRACGARGSEATCRLYLRARRRHVAARDDHEVGVTLITLSAVNASHLKFGRVWTRIGRNITRAASPQQPPARAMEELIHSELLEEAHSAVSEWNERSKSKMASAAAATAATAGAGTAASAKELRTPTKRVLPAAAMPPPTEDRAAALRLDTVTVRWQLPAEGGQVEAQHGRLTGQLRVLHDGRIAAEAAQPSGATSPSAHRSLRFECAGRECCLTVRRGGQAWAPLGLGLGSLILTLILTLTLTLTPCAVAARWTPSLPLTPGGRLRVRAHSGRQARGGGAAG